jgi:hypothetical protein
MALLKDIYLVQKDPISDDEKHSVNQICSDWLVEMKRRNMM